MVGSDFHEPVIQTDVLGWVIVGLIMLGIAAGFGFWTMCVYRLKGRPPRSGFWMGFVLAFVPPVIGGVLALVIAHRLPDLRLPVSRADA